MIPAELTPGMVVEHRLLGRQGRVPAGGPIFEIEYEGPGIPEVMVTLEPLRPDGTVRFVWFVSNLVLPGEGPL